ncbi:protein FAM228A isoform X2 [Syngnathoides biaculeatus]|uniref:protein FAM228A isoform X2 n=1 Tax=Syngnathoides biaculeatus TaxID=300417 RepID=UPI002ADE40A9|nr:protein FAM228A isoform X2 [Syngnathoides biaculeatus]
MNCTVNGSQLSSHWSRIFLLLPVMWSNKRNDGFITYDAAFDIRLLASEAAESKYSRPEVRLCAPVKKRNVGVYIKQNKRDDATMGVQGPRPWRGCLSHASTRRVQGKLEAELKEAKELIQPLLDTEKELENFLSRHDEAKAMKREVMRKVLHEDFWAPLQKKLDYHMATCNPAEVKRRQNLYQQFLRHGNAKGHVFLDTCDLNEYNPYLLYGKKPHKCKLRVAELKEMELLYELSKMKKTRCEAGCLYKRNGHSKVQHGDYVSPVVSSFNVQSVDKDHTNYMSSSLDVPYHVRETSARDGTCHHPGCWFSR